MTVQALSEKELYPFKGLWHGIKIKHFLKYLEQGFMEARTVHRHWKGGISFPETDFKHYEASTYMKGWCMTRERQYAFMWSDVTLLLDAELIKRDFKVKPIAWSARRNPRNNFKIEMEEFIFSNLIDQTDDEIKKEFQEIKDSLSISEKREFLREYPDHIDYNCRAGLKTIDIMKYVKGFFIADDLADLYVEEIKQLQAHPLFKGFYDFDKASKQTKYRSLCHLKHNY